MPPDASLAAVCRSRPRSVVCRQRWARAGSIPMAVMASALRIAASAAFSARTDASLASISLRRVARSLTTAKPNSSTAPAMPMVPSTGWIMKTTARNTGDQGASNSGMMPAPPTYPRSVDRSRSPCADTAAAGPPRLGHRAGQHRAAELAVEPRAGPRQQPQAHRVEQAEGGQRHDDHGAQREQRVDVAGGQHPVVDLQHVHRHRQHEQVDAGAEQRHRHQHATARGQRQGKGMRSLRFHAGSVEMPRRGWRRARKRMIIPQPCSRPAATASSNWARRGSSVVAA